MDTLTGGNGTSYAFSYNYAPNADFLPSEIDSTTTNYKQLRSYDSLRDTLSQVATKWSTTVLTQYDYAYNAYGQRSSAKQSGTAFADYGTSTYYQYAYDSRGQLTSANARAGVDVTSTTEPGMPGRLFAYAYDNAGNRTSLNHNVPVSPSIAEAFTANNLNQITARENHALSVQGSVASNASIKVLVGGHSSVQAENSMAGRAANYWGAEAILANESAPANQSITVVAALVAGGSGGKDLVRTTTKTGFLPAASESLTYDADGNLTADGRFTYTYDEANRLTTVTTSSAAAAAGAPNVRLTFAYDAGGRRISRKIEDYSGA